MRVLLQETLDPDGALFRWISADLRAAGHEVWCLPVQELGPRLGPGGYAELFVELGRSLAPALALLHWPYDLLDEASLQAARAAGLVCVGLGFDDPVFAPRWRARPGMAALAAALERRFDLYLSTDERCAAELRGAGLGRVGHLPWAASEAWLAAPAAQAPLPEILLLGSAYPRRVALLRALSAAGLPLRVVGRGWAEALPEGLPGARFEGRLAGAQARALLGRAAAVICPADWEDRAVPMVKARLLEVVAAGGLPLAERVPDLGTYFPSGDLQSWGDSEELVVLARACLADPAAGDARRRSLAARLRREHLWRQRWPQLERALDAARPGTLAALRAVLPARAGAPLSVRSALRRLALDLEAAAPEAAAGVWGELACHGPLDPEAQFALGRCHYAAGRPQAALPWLRAALAGLPATGVALPLPWPPAQGARGLGRVGLLSPAPELWAHLCAALLDSGEAAAAAAALVECPLLEDPDGLVALAAMLDPPRGPRAAPFRAALQAALLAVEPGLSPAALHAQRARWGREGLAGPRSDPHEAGPRR